MRIFRGHTGLIALGLLPLSIAIGAHAQSARDSEKLLRDALLKKRMIPRGFSAEGEIHWRWDGNALVLTPPTVHTFGVLIVNSVKMKGDSVEIKGDRHTLLREKDKYTLSASGRSVKMTVDLVGSNASSVMPNLVSTLFFQSVDQARESLPSQYRTSLPMNFPCCGKSTPPVSAECDEGSPGPFDLSMKGMMHPIVVFQQEAEFSDEARQARFNGTVGVSLTVDERGRSSELWLGHPVGMGLDENALKAVSKYQFKPATCHGKPVPTVLFVEVNFSFF